jgi:tripartite-type tricarboxylate transporter receptor subunit TctC
VFCRDNELIVYLLKQRRFWETNLKQNFQRQTPPSSVNRIASVALVAVISLLSTTTVVHAQTDYPNRPIKVVVPYTAGGNVDITARIYSKKLSEQLGQQVIVENRPGASTIIGSQSVAKSTPDGYTLLITGTITSAHTMNPGLFATLPYDTNNDFAPISLLTQLSLFVVVHPSLPANTLQELIALAKAKPKQINVATGGSGGSANLAVELLTMASGAQFTAVHYKGNAPGLADTVAGQTSMMIETTSTALPHIKGGKLRALAVTSDKRSALLPDVPTVAESGYPGYDVTLKLGMLAPAGTPRAIIDKLAAEVAIIARDPATQKLFAEQGSEAISSTPQAFATEIAADIIKWTELMKKNGIKAE